MSDSRSRRDQPPPDASPATAPSALGRLLGRRATRIVLAGAAVLALASAALAFWTSAGSGSATATAGSAQAVTVTPGTPSPNLYPGGQTDVALTISNPNPFPVHVGSLALDLARGAAGFGVDGTHGSCDLSALSFASQTNGGSGWSVPPKIGSTDGSLAIDLPGALSMATNAPGSCQGASFSVYLTAGP